jgi:hypothetical protein
VGDELDDLLPADVGAALPAPYARALQGLLAGEDDAAIARAAEVEVAAVPALVRVAVTKLLEEQRRQRVATTRAIAAPAVGPSASGPRGDRPDQEGHR